MKMITGDNASTAKIIAEEAGIISENDNRNPNAVMEGTIFISFEKKGSLFFILLEGQSFSALIGGIVCREHRRANCNCISANSKNTS